MIYRRAFIPGGSFFFTVVTERRPPLLASMETVRVLRTAIQAVRSTRPFEVDAMVELPDHLHLQFGRCRFRDALAIGQDVVHQTL